MSEATFETPIRIEIDHPTETAPADDIEDMIRINPDHPFARIAKKIRAHKLALATSTLGGITINFVTSNALRSAESHGKIPFETFKEINEQFLTLQSANNIALTATGIGLISVTNELVSSLLHSAGKEKWADISRKAIPILGAITMAALNVYGETDTFTGTKDTSDIIFGLGAIAPSFWAIRTMYASDYRRIKELGFAAAGIFKRTTAGFNTEAIRIAPAEIEVEEMIRFPNQ